MPGWRAYYAGGVSFDSEETRPEELPEGVVCVVEYLTPPYRRLVSGGDWYVWDGERWSQTGTGEWGTWQERPDGIAVRSCGGLPEVQYEKTMDRAASDMNWPD